MIYWMAAAAVGMVPFMLISSGSSFGESARSIMLLSFALLVPFPALLVRRLHDQDRSGWWALLWAPALIEAIFNGGQSTHWAALMLIGVCNLSIIIFLIWPGSNGENSFGRDPREMALVS